MSDQEKFLSRWSRRKLEPADEKVPSEPPQAADAPAASADAAKPAAASPARQGEAAPIPEFDLSKLPSLDSIGADSDIKAFLQSGVPLALRNAALRRAWSADPAIRNYIGPAEYAWDFTDPKAMPGFGDLGPDVDIKKLVAEVFGDARSDIEPLRGCGKFRPGAGAIRAAGGCQCGHGHFHRKRISGGGPATRRAYRWRILAATR